jgi:cystathionine gamma-lyase
MIGGAVIVNDDALAKRIKLIEDRAGAVPSPFDCFLAHRGLKTLGLRMQRHSETTLALAKWLEQHPQIEKVYYPGLPSHPQHELAKRQMKRGYGGMVSIVVKGGKARTLAFLKALNYFVLAKSLGGVESLSNHAATMTHGGMPAEVRKKLGISDGLVRLSVGIENFDDLRDDLARALG